MRSNKKLVDFFPDILTGGGIFTALQSYPVPWIDDVTGATLDTEYFFNISGQKTPSPLVRKLASTGALTTENVQTLARVLYSMFSVPWAKQYATLSAQYDPISNYDMTETETTTGTDSNTVTNTGTQTTARTGTQGTVTAETTTGTGSDNGESGVYGFNSSTAVGDATTEMNTTQSATDNIQATRTDNLTDRRTDNLTETGSGTRLENRTLTRTGNIGVTTSQQMLQSERELWMWSFFYDVVFKNVDKVLSIATYTDGYMYSVDGGSSGGGSSDLTEVINKLNAIDNKIDTNTASINANIVSAETSINTNIDSAETSINTNIDSKATSINLSINQLRASTFDAIDGVTTREY